MANNKPPVTNMEEEIKKSKLSFEELFSALIKKLIEWLEKHKAGDETVKEFRNKAEKAKKGFSDTMEESMELFAAATVENAEALEEVLEVVNNVTTATQNVLDTISKNGNMTVEELGNTMTEFQDDLTSERDHLQNLIPIKSIVNMNEAIAEAFFGETLSSEEIADHSNKLATLYQHPSGKTIVAVNENAALSREITEENYSASTRYYKLTEDGKLQRYASDDPAVMRSFVDSLTYIGSDKEKLKEVIPLAVEINTLENDMVVFSIGNVGYAPYNMKGAEDKVALLKKVASRTNDLQKIFMTDKEAFLKEFEMYEYEIGRALNLNDKLYSPQFIESANKIVSKVNSIIADSKNNNFQQGYMQLLSLENDMNTMIEKFISEQEKARFDFKKDKPLVFSERVVSSRFLFKDAKGLENAAVTAVNTSAKKLSLKKCNELTNGIEKISYLADVFKSKGEIAEEGNIQRLLGNDNSIRVYDKESKTLLVNELVEGAMAIKAYPNIDSIDASLEGKEFLVAAAIKENKEVSYQRPLKDDNISKLMLDKGMIAYMVQNNVNISAYKENVSLAKERAARESIPDNVLNKREEMYKSLCEGIRNGSLFRNRDNDSRFDVNYVIPRNKESISITLPSKTAENADKFYINFDESGLVIKDFALKLGNDKSMPAIHFNCETEDVTNTLIEKAETLYSDGMIDMTEFMKLNETAVRIGMLIENASDEYNKAIEQELTREEELTM